MLKVYLGGPISGKTYAEAVEWREQFESRLRGVVEVLSPMRGKEYLKDAGVLGCGYPAHILSNHTTIYARDRFDIERSDIVVFNFEGESTLSIGSLVELGLASALHKMVIVIMGADSPYRHAFVTESANIIVGNEDDAIEVVLGIAA